ncbi:MAG: type II toxin-antitoxin system VapC family toxin [Thermoplasmata archaeon]
MARLPEVVVDASAVCKWFVPEVDSEAALGLRDAHADGRIRIIAPDLLSYEVANVLRHHPAMSADRLRSAMRHFFDLQVALVPPSSALLGLASGYAHREKLTIYDAVYAVLAESRSCRLVTADSRLLGTSNRAVPISQWTLGH